MESYWTHSESRTKCQKRVMQLLTPLLNIVKYPIIYKIGSTSYSFIFCFTYKKTCGRDIAFPNTRVMCFWWLMIDTSTTI